MPRSDRDKRPSVKLIGGAFAGLVAVSLGALGISFGFSKQSEYEWDASQNTAEYARYAYHPKRDSCARLPAKDQANCIGEARDETRQNERDEQDLVAQKTTAIWTFLMGSAAIVGMMLSAIGVFLVWITFRETRRAAEISGETYRAFVDLERARVVANMGAVLWNPPHITAASVGLVNVGKSAATIVSAHYDFMDDCRFPPTFNTTAQIDRGLPSGDNDSFTMRSPQKDTFKTHPYVGGYVIYQTAFGHAHHAYFLGKIEYIPENPDAFFSQRSGWQVDTTGCNREERESRFGWPADD